MEAIMTFLKRFTCCATVFGLAAATGAYADVSSINSAVLYPREFNDIPGATLTPLNFYPGFVVFSESGVSAPIGFANRDAWRFSANGTTAYQFANTDYFEALMNVTLTGNPISPRKEAGFLLDTIGGQGQFIVNTDAHEVVAFGGPFPFYAFPATYDSGKAITLGIRYFQEDGKGMIVYSANGVQSPVLPFTNLEYGIIDGSTLGGYFQIVNDPANASNGGAALFQGIRIVAVPEPSVLSLLGLGIVALVFRRRR
jgi:hypothetical protein